jgi:outer membrane lipopolysaccharide assembly protein LptE/RlpB
LLLSACGWQLQGARRVPESLSPLYLELSDEHSSFAQSLQQRLREAGVNVTTDRGRAQAILSISKDVGGHNVSSVSALNEPQQYEVYYNVAYRLTEPALPICCRSHRAARTMSYDKTLALAAARGAGCATLRGRAGRLRCRGA